MFANIDLIETYWDVKNFLYFIITKRRADLIETYWDVKTVYDIDKVVKQLI